MIVNEQFEQAMQRASVSMQRRDYAAASEGFRRALEINADQPKPLFGLSQALRALGDLPGAADACGRLLAQRPEDPLVVRLLAMITAEQGRAPAAERLLLRMVELAPESAMPLTDLANLCSDQHRFIDAIDWFQRAVELAPADVGLQLGLARCLSVVGRAQGAYDAYARCLSLEENHAVALLGSGNALRALGRSEEARVVFQQCLLREDLYADACWSLASMRDYQFSEAELETMQAVREREQTTAPAAIALDFAIGKALDDRGNYSPAWAHYQAGSEEKRAQLQYDGVDFQLRMDKQISTYDQQCFQRPTAAVESEVTPIFIVGMPRAGSTLLEQILASHSQVEGTSELPFLKRIAGQAQVDGDTSTDTLAAFGQAYLRASEASRNTQCRYFIDKLPDNFPYVGFIHLIMPQAIVIDARRNPLDTCVANLRQLYAAGKEFTYDPLELGEMYLQYLRLMQHWERVLPGKVLTVNYEDVVQDTEQQVRRLLQHCGLEWEDACLRFHETDRVVTTASSEQVRKPVYTDSVGSWRHYESELGELMEILEPTCRAD
jgi:tetratricopeptide (TPR) repeat protein